MSRGTWKSLSSPPNRGGAVVGHCKKYTVGHGVRRGGRPGCRPWSCGDCAGVLASPTGGVVVAAGIPSFRPGSCSDQAVCGTRGEHAPSGRLAPAPTSVGHVAASDPSRAEC